MITVYVTAEQKAKYQPILDNRPEVWLTEVEMIAYRNRVMDLLGNEFAHQVTIGDLHSIYRNGTPVTLIVLTQETLAWPRKSVQ